MLAVAGTARRRYRDDGSDRADEAQGIGGSKANKPKEPPLQHGLADIGPLPASPYRPDGLPERAQPTGNPFRKERDAYRKSMHSQPENCFGINEPSEEPSSTVASATVRDLKTKLVWQVCPKSSSPWHS